MMNVLVTGAVGNVGYITAIVCAEAGLEVVAHDRLKCEPSEVGPALETVVGFSCTPRLL
jgi:NAD(P)-dependent dehydrogenase (short-subunit alcohol dehydrogenase family)